MPVKDIEIFPKSSLFFRVRIDYDKLPSDYPSRYEEAFDFHTDLIHSVLGRAAFTDKAAFALTESGNSMTVTYRPADIPGSRLHRNGLDGIIISASIESARVDFENFKNELSRINPSYEFFIDKEY